MGSLVSFPVKASLSTPGADGASTQARQRRVPTLAARAAFADTLARVDFQALRRLASRVAQGMVDADDLLQDALERSVRHFDSFTPGTNLNAWLSTIMQRIVIDECRKRSRRRTVSADDLADPAAPTAPQPEDQPPPAWTRFELWQVRQAAEQLREPLRTTFHLHLVEGRAYAAIAAAQGVPVATVGTRLRRARQRVRALLEAGLATPQGGLLRGDFTQTDRVSDKRSGQWSSPSSPPAPRRRPPGRKATTAAMAASQPSWMPSPGAIAARCSLC